MICRESFDGLRDRLFGALSPFAAFKFPDPDGEALSSDCIMRCLKAPFERRAVAFNASPMDLTPFSESA